jgi:hypothetical protein
VATATRSSGGVGARRRGGDRREAKRRLELEPKGRERKAIEKDFEESAKRESRRARRESLELGLTLTASPSAT